MKRLFTFIALVAMSIGTWAWTWTGETAAAGSWYLYHPDWGFIHADASSSYPTKTVSDATIFTITATGTTATKLAYKVGNATYYLNNNNGTMLINTTGSNLYVRIGNATDGYYITTYSATSLNTSGSGNNRYLNVWDGGAGWSRGNSGNKTQWRFISADQMAVYNARNLAFSATIANVADLAAGAVSASVKVSSYELQNYADREGTKSKATFVANSIAGSNFEGWYSDADFTNWVSSSATYTIDLSYEKQTATLYAKYVQGAVSTVITRELTNLDWYTTYAIADLFNSNNPNPMVVTRDGVAITELTTKNESSITLKVSQAAVTDEYEAATDVEFTFAVAPATVCEPVVIFSNAAESSKIENNDMAKYDWGFAADVRSISFDYKCAFASNKTIYLDQLVDGEWKNVWSSNDRPTGYTNKNVDLSTNHESANAIRFRMPASGIASGSMYVKNVVINGENGISVPEKRDTTLTEVNDLTNIDGGVIELGYTSVATIQYEITDVAATNGNATVVLTPQETIDNECGNFGAYHFNVVATSSERVSVITANAHFFTSDGYDKVVPVKVELTKQSQTLSWTSAENIEINVDGELSASATATSGLDVAYSSSNESVVKYENGAWVVVGAGEATIYADQAGNDSYEAATQISKQVTVKKLTQTLSWSDEVNTIFDNAELNVTATATSGLAVTYGSDNADVIKYEDGAWVVAGVGTATIYADQAGNDTYQAANQIYMTITVLSAQTSKESGEDAWTKMPGETESETASMYVTTNGETLITKTAQYKHGTICLPYSGTVSGATLYRLVNSEKDEVGNVNGLVFEFLGEDAASSCNFEAGMPYVYFANDAQQAWTRTSNTSEDVQAKTLSNGLTGTYERKKLTNEEYFLYTADDSFHKAGTNVVVPAFRAYITTEDMENVADLQTPGKAQIRFGFEGYKPVATGMENAVVMNATKALVNGKIVIIRGDKAYTINGSKIQ